MASPTNNNEPSSPDAQPNNHRRKKSIVWEYFTIENVDAGCTRACCKQCKKSFAYISGSKLAGTSHLKRHITLGICPVSRCNNQEKNKVARYTPDPNTDGFTVGSDPPRKRYRGTPVPESIPFDQDRCIYEVAKLIILHEYPLHIVEQPSFIDFVRALQPQFNMVSLDAIQDECVGVYLREKQSLLSLIGGIPGRVSLSLDLWVSDQSLGYIIFTGQFVDGDLKLHRRILNIIVIPSPDSEVVFNHAVAACLTDWSLESKLFSLTLDQSFASTTIKENLTGLLSIKNPHILDGQLIIGNCYARILGRLAQDALGSMAETIRKVRERVKYVNLSEVHEEKFVKLKHQFQVPNSNNLIIDDKTKWNTTYHMLVAASKLKEVFSCLDTPGTNFKDNLSMEEWKQVEILCTYLKLLFDAANVLTSTKNPTSNVFFHEAWKIQFELSHVREDPFVSNLIKPLREKFDKYWKESNLVLAIAVVMDPRFKMKLVEFSFSRIYGEEAETMINIVNEGVHELYLEYIVLSLPPPTYVKTEIHQEGTLLSGGDGLSDFDVYISEITSNQDVKSELDQYLEESLLPRVQDFDVLGWWKLNRLKYPTLSRMAADVLSIPVSIVPPDSVFDTESKKMDDYRSSLSPMTLEALICAKDWLQYGSSEFHNAIVKMEF